MNQIKEYSEIEAGISALRDKFNFVPDCSTKSGYSECKNAYKEVRAVEISLDKKRKELGEAARDHLKAVNSQADAIDAELKMISSPFKIAKEEYDAREAEKEAQRISDIHAQIAGIENFVAEARGKSSSEISDIVQCVSLIDVSEGFDEFTQDALKAKQKTIDSLSESMLLAVQKESAEAEQRKARIESALVTIKNYPMGYFGKSAEEIKAGIDDLAQKNLAGFGEQEAAAKAAVDVALAQLNQMLESAIKLEEILAREAKHQAEQKEREQEELRIENEKAEALRLECEQESNAVQVTEDHFEPSFNQVFNEDHHHEPAHNLLVLSRENLIEAVSVYFNINNTEAETHLINAFGDAQKAAA